MSKPNLRTPTAITLRDGAGLMADFEARYRQAERDHAAAVEALSATENAVSHAAAAYDASLGQGREAALAARRAQADAEVDRDVARHTVDRLSGQLKAAREAAVHAEIEHLSNVARKSAAEFEAVTRRELKIMEATARRLVRLWANAHLAQAAAIRAGANEFELPGIEDFRAVPRRPREVIETKRVTRWVHPYTCDGLSDEQTASVLAQGDTAYLRGGGEPMRLSHQAEFDRIVYVEREQGERLVSLVSALRVPGLMADEVPGWSAPDGMTAHAVIERLAALEQAPAPDRRDRRERKIELRRVMPNHGLADAE